jgi:hypothetical protein
MGVVNRQMTGSDPGSGGEQVTLEEFSDPNRCTEIAVDTDERCRHPALPGLTVCHVHAEAEDFAQLAVALSPEEMAK